MILLDTNVVSELMKEAANPAVERWYLLNEEETVLPSIALAELTYGVARLSTGAKRRMLEARLTEWRVRYSGRTVPFGPAAAMRYGPMLASVVASGRTMSLPDAQIAAIALEEDALVATRNIADFEPSGVSLVNPWD
ncbi:PIN domain-containing protein [Sphingomonas sp. MAH-20]|uniref:Ribonuclease VapC n=1 Tax=Sphingomonas horti TaxID=2682842 RepID=A0A6I4J3B3_9SPHN|nr:MULTISPECIES: type II toxin-antitoxin system VapC family toxin [Sphingomonas]MBA2919179.1 type II toxin-antitoxin system VapC family toxin [Sphingomonas sp. CGMCC 1.13658]MVO79212.1 PIN domain-containing protein [Sphingomonas horti]